MLFDGIKLVEGSEVQNLVVDTGSTFPSSPNAGEMFYRTDAGNEGLYTYDGTQWVRHLQEGDSLDALLPVIPGVQGTWTKVTVDDKGIVQSGTNPTTLSGYGITDAQPLDGDLTAIANLVATSGLLRKTAANTWSLDTNTYITGNQTISLSGDVTGSGSTAITTTLAASGVAAGSYGSSSAVATFNVDSKGRITSAANTSIAIDASAVTSGTFVNARISQSSVTQHQAALTIAESQITDGAILARIAGNESISGNWQFNTALVVATPTASNHATTKGYVDSLAQGLATKPAVRVATTGNLVATYNNGTAGVGATLTGTGSLPTIDGIALDVGNGVLVRAQTNPAQNGRYNVTALSPNWILTRCGLCDEASEIPGAFVFVNEGSLYAATGWVQTVANASTFVVGTDAITVTQFSAAGAYTAGSGLILSGNSFNVVTASTARIVVNADNIDLATIPSFTPSTYRSVTVDAYGRVTAGTNPTTLADYGITDAQAIDPDLTALADLISTGLIVRTGAGAAATRSLAVSGVGLSVSNADGLAGNPTITSNATASNLVSTIVARDSSGNFSAGTITATLSGNATTATALQTARSIAATGDATWSVSFDGSTNASAALTLAASGVTAGTYKSVTVDAKGRVTAGTNPTTLAGYGITDAQPLDSDLTALAGTTTTGMYTITGVGTSATRSLAVSGIGLSVSNANGVAGNPTITSNATSANTVSTIVSRDASGNFSAGTITATLSGNASSATVLETGRTFSFTGDATGTSGSFDGSTNVSTALTLATVNTSPQTDAFRKITVNGKGLVTATSAVASSDITTALGYTPVNKNGDTMTNFLTLHADPTAALHAATKQYVDNAASGMNVHQAARVGTTGNLVATYNNGTAGVGATLTGTGALPTIDGITLVAGDRVLVKNQTTQTQNGVYVVTTLSPNWVLTRAADFDDSPDGEIAAGDALYLQEGTQAGTQWVQTTAGAITVGTTNIVFTQFGGPGSYSAGAGLTLTGATFAVGTASASRIVVNADNIDLATTGVTAGTFNSVNVDSYGRVTGGTNNIS